MRSSKNTRNEKQPPTQTKPSTDYIQTRTRVSRQASAHTSSATPAPPATPTPTTTGTRSGGRYTTETCTGYRNGQPSTRSTETFLQNLMDTGRTKNDREGVHSLINTVFQYVAPITKFFSEKTFRHNLKSLNKELARMHEEHVEVWKRDMFLAVQNHNLASIRKLVKGNGFDLNSTIGPVIKDEYHLRAPREHTALTWASWIGDLSLVKYLVEQGADASGLTPEGLGPIHFSSMRACGFPTLKHFIENPKLRLPVDFCSDKSGSTPLMHACAFGNHSTATYLLEQKAEVNRQDGDGKTALFYAVTGGHLDLVKLLISYKACTYLRDNFNSTVLHHLVRAYEQESDSNSKFTAVLHYLVEEKGLSVTDRESNGNTALHDACKNGQTELAKYLLQKGAVIEAKKDKWETPLWSLVQGKYPRREIIMMLLDKGANFEHNHVIGLTLIQYACRFKKNYLLVQAILEANKTLKARRMKAMRDRRREILSESNTTNALVGFPPTTYYKPKMDFTENTTTSNKIYTSSSEEEEGEVKDTTGKIDLPDHIIEISSTSSSSESSSSDEDNNTQSGGGLQQRKQQHPGQRKDVGQESSSSDSSTTSSSSSDTDTDTDENDDAKECTQQQQQQRNSQSSLLRKRHCDNNQSTKLPQKIKRMRRAAVEQSDRLD